MSSRSPAAHSRASSGWPTAAACSQRLDLTAGNLIEFAARCDAYDSDGRCIGSDITDPGDFAAAGEQGDAAIPVGITFRLSYPGRPVKLAHRV